MPATMRNLLFTLLAIFIFSCSGKKQDETPQIEKAKLISKRTLTAKELRRDNCAKSAEAAEKAEESTRRALKADNTEDIHDNAEEAMEEFHKALKFSKKCGCDEAEILADEGFSLARKASLAKSMHDARTYAEIAGNSAQELASHANQCSGN